MRGLETIRNTCEGLLRDFAESGSNPNQLRDRATVY